MIAVPDEALATFYLVAKYVYVSMFVSWIALVYRFPRPGLVVGGTIVSCVYVYLAIQAPLGRAYALFPGTDRTFNVAMVATAATGHSAFESYQVGFGDHEPFWRWSMSLVSLGDPENVVTVYVFLTPIVTTLLALSLYFGLRGGRDGSGGTEESTPGPSSPNGWEAALIVYCVLLLSSSPYERFGVFESFWSMTFLLKPNHVLGFVLIAAWVRAFTSTRPLVRTLGAALLLALLSWVFLLHWAYLLVGLALYPLVAALFGRVPEWRRACFVGGVSLSVALPYVVFLFVNFPPAPTTVGRHIWESTLAFREGYWNVFAVGYEHGPMFLLSLVGLGFMFRRRSRTDVVWLAVVGGCVVVWIGYNVGFAIRKTVEPEEFYFFTRFVLSVLAGTGAFFVIGRLGPLIAPRESSIALTRGVCLFLVVTLPVTFPYWWDPTTMDRYFANSRPPIAEEVKQLTAWAREATDRDAVFVASARTASWVAALAGRRVLLTGNLRPPNDYERRRELTEGLLVARGRQYFEEARDVYHVTHVALDEDLLVEFDVAASSLEALPWLETVYRDDRFRVLALNLGRRR